MRNELLYYARDRFTGAELVSMGQAGVQVGGVGASTGFISFVSGVTFEYSLPDTAELSTIGTDTVGTGMGGAGTAAVCFGEAEGERQGPRPIQDVELDSGAGAWLPFFVSTVGFETGSSELGPDDYDAIADTLRALVSERMQPLFDAGAVDFRLEVHGHAAGRYQDAQGDQEAFFRNLDLSRDRADAVRTELQALLTRNEDSFGTDGADLPATASGPLWAESELGAQATTDNDARYRTAEIIVWVEVCGSR